jgi:tetratricopeptide (TPR) repeat protein
VRFVLLYLTFVLLWATGTTVAHAQWHEARSDHFIIYSDERPEQLRTFAERLERFDEAVRLVRRMPDPKLTESNRLKVFLLRNPHTIEKLAGSSWVAGFYVTRASGSAAFVPSRAGSKHNKTELDAEAVFFHEYAHHLQLQTADLALPPWMTEGFAEFFARTQLRDDGSVVIGVPPAYRAYALNNWGGLTLREMLGADTSLTGEEWELVYGRGWLLTHYLTFNRERRGQVDRYVSDIQKGVPPLKAAQQSFGDLDALSGEVARYRRESKLPHLVLNGSQIRTGPIAVRRLSAGESAIMPVFMRSKSGATKKTRNDIAADARKLASAHPDDVFVQSALAEAELDAENFGFADAAADRALASDPNSPRALIYKGRAQMELARKADSGADWPSIRRWFLKANRVDPEAAEPLMLYYKSFGYAGAKPNKNAAEGLIYSLALAPQDTRLRLTVVRHLLAEGRMGEARRYFTPYAFTPHGEKKYREAASRTMAAIVIGQPDPAIAQIDRIEKMLKDED